MVKSTDGGVTWIKPVAVSQLVDLVLIDSTSCRVNSFPAADVTPNGDLYVAWSTQVSDSSGGLCPGFTTVGCHSAAVYSKSTNGGATWSAPALIFPALDSSTRTAVGYPVTQPDGSTLSAPAPRRLATLFPPVASPRSGAA